MVKLLQWANILLQIWNCNEIVINFVMLLLSVAICNEFISCYATIYLQLNHCKSSLHKIYSKYHCKSALPIYQDFIVAEINFVKMVKKIIHCTYCHMTWCATNISLGYYYIDIWSEFCCESLGRSLFCGIYFLNNNGYIWLMSYLIAMIY